jgi:hypothetical protein
MTEYALVTKDQLTEYRGEDPEVYLNAGDIVEVISNEGEYLIVQHPEGDAAVPLNTHESKPVTEHEKNGTGEHDHLCPKCGRYSEHAPRFYKDGNSLYVHKKELRTGYLPVVVITESCDVKADPANPNNKAAK